MENLAMLIFLVFCVCLFGFFLFFFVCVFLFSSALLKGVKMFKWFHILELKGIRTNNPPKSPYSSTEALSIFHHRCKAIKYHF